MCVQINDKINEAEVSRRVLYQKYGLQLQLLLPSLLLHMPVLFPHRRLRWQQKAFQPVVMCLDPFARMLQISLLELNIDQQ
jgi:hypothetical protein